MVRIRVTFRLGKGQNMHGQQVNPGTGFWELLTALRVRHIVVMVGLGSGARKYILSMMVPTNIVSKSIVSLCVCLQLALLQCVGHVIRVTITRH